MKTLFTIALFVELIFGLGFVAMPATLVGQFGVTLSDFGVTLARLFGSALLAFVVLLWYGRSSQNSETQRAVLTSMFTYWAISTIFALIGQLSGVMNVMGWGTIALHAGMAIAFGVFLFR